MKFSDVVFPSIVGLLVIGIVSITAIVHGVDNATSMIVGTAIGGIVGFLRPPQGTTDKKDPPPSS